MDKSVTIYALCDPDTNEVRYIGQTVCFKTRLYEHLYNEIHKQTPKTVWVQGLRKNGKRPKIVAIEIVAMSEANAAENKWIHHYLNAGNQLTNLKIR